MCARTETCVEGRSHWVKRWGLSVPRSITHVYITWRCHLLVAQSVTHTVTHTSSRAKGDPQYFGLFHPEIKQKPKNLSPWDLNDIRVIDKVQLCKYLADSAGNHWFFEGFYQEQQSKQTPAPPRLLPTFARARRG